MLPRWHIFLGAIFTISLYFLFPQTNLLNLLLIFLASFLIDFDHYVASVIKTRRLSLTHSFDYHRKALKQEIAEKKKGIRKRGDFHFFHTVEFHLLLGVIGIFFSPIFYIFIGMVFHSLLDLLSLAYTDRIYRREYFLFNWLYNKII